MYRMNQSVISHFIYYNIISMIYDNIGLCTFFDTYQTTDVQSATRMTLLDTGEI